MDVFKIREQLISDYRAFTSGFVDVRDERIKEHVDQLLDSGEQWPDPWLSLNPSFEPGGTITDLVRERLLHSECERIFRVKQDSTDPGSSTLTLHRHQREAVEVARSGKSYVLTTGTGSGKSLAYIVPIVDDVLRQREANNGQRVRGVKAIVVYPMNALANSQLHELTKFLRYGYPTGGEPVTFARYTGQEKEDERRVILADPPDILLTNYVMLELVLTRPDERKNLIRAAKGLRFLVLDELHTYRGRQGADVALLVRRLRDACESPGTQVVGTSATMASGGTTEEQKAAVADVATRLFGAEVTPDRVIGETLRRATAMTNATALKDAVHAALQRSHDGQTLPYDHLATDELASWIETTFGLDTEPGTGRLVRRQPTTVPHAAASLAELTALETADCADAIRAVLLEGSRSKDAAGRPLFAFRLHQFLSKGDTVYVSIEPENTRYVTSTYQLRVPGRADKALLPLGFCRECGQEYAVVAKVRRDGKTTYVPRKDADASGGDDVTGYLYISTDHPWPADPISEGRIPDHWLVTLDNGDTVVQDSKRKHMPIPVRVGPEGVEQPNGAGMQAWFVPTPFAFCLRCRVAYEQVRGADFAKLATLDKEGRSSAVTLLSSSIVRSLKALGPDELREDARKLLTFVDNRQDASLQAGHFNDFVQVAELRAGLFRALDANPDGLTHEDVAQRVADALALPMTEFSKNPQAKFSARDQALRALRRVIEYRLYVDLQRGWRVTMPNLEQTGLLRVQYVDLPEVAHDDDSWRDTHAALRDAPPALRQEIAETMLDELRRVLAVDVECLTDQGFDRVYRESGQHLMEPWAMADGEKSVPVGTAFPRSGKAGRPRTELNLSGRSAFGRYLHRDNSGLGSKLTAGDAQDVITDLLLVLERAGLLTLVTADEDGVPGYRLKASALRWVAGDGKHGAEDRIRRTFDSESVARVNPFFVSLYQDLAAGFTGLHAKEHTAQVPPDLREEREQAFRDGKTLPLLYCSPTMELGVDISSLNAVGLRNVPPTPANYAQRSGRAGRQGQPAIVVTYCATGNAHDSYYFRKSRDMVAGSVAPPRLDLTNEDLVRSHVNAIWLAETDQSMRASITSIVDAAGDKPTLEILPEVWRALNDPDAQRRATRRAEDVIGGLRHTWEQSKEPVPWWYDGWVADQVAGAAKALDEALGRWRSLYRAAKAEFDEQSKLSVDPSARKQTRDNAARRAADARNQLVLLANEESELGQTDFYSYRYLASEGFLPGYSFPRLPLAAYIPARKAYGFKDGDYLQRPRFVAISEFGPGALIYHEGARYQVQRVQLPRSAGSAAAADTEEARRCEACGYHHPVRVGTDVCDSCGTTLGAKTYGLLRLQAVFTRRRDRISSDEEERRRAGFELELSYRFHEHGERAAKVEATALVTDDRPLADLTYGDSATIRVANIGRRRRKDLRDRGFWLDLSKGEWLTEKQATDATVDADDLVDTQDVQTKAKVIPYVEDRRNLLVIRLADAVGESTATTLRYALERGIEATFQLEDSELESQPLPDLDRRGRMLLTESAEGGAGALRRLVAEPDAISRVARAALEIAHFDPDTGEDCGHAPGARERCEQACYDCLLSYGNQSTHALINRHEVRDLLLALAGATVRSGSGGRTRGEQRERLDATVESSLERSFVDWLDECGLRLPDRNQVTVSEARARPDFVYNLATGPVAVFVDGPVHDSASQAERDAAAEERLMDLGWMVVRFRHGEDWQAVAGRYPSVFGSGGSGS